MELSLSSSVQYVPRVGPRMATLLQKLGIETVYDLLLYAPSRYNDFSKTYPVARVPVGETVTITGTVSSIGSFRTKSGKRMISARLTDESGSLDIIWFNQIFILKIIHKGDRLRVSGKCDWFGAKRAIIAPEYEIIPPEDTPAKSLHTGRLVPVYSETRGLSSKWLRGRIAQVLMELPSTLTDPLPQLLRDQESLMDLPNAIASVHFPESLDEAARARERLAFDELLVLLLRAHEAKQEWKHKKRAHEFPLSQHQTNAWMDALPFHLTADQQSAVTDVLSDIASDIPMNRLLVGDVGSGKTAVAAAACYAVCISGHHAALLAPTQILARQHMETLTGLLSVHNIDVELILGGSAKTGKKQPVTRGTVYVGTHALLSKQDLLPGLDLVIVDEQQRFGVKQRAALRQMNEETTVPHQLTMSATPIPRTIAQTALGNLDLSTITTMPHGRKPVKTWVVPNAKRDSAYKWMKDELTKNHTQAFIVCPLIDESETLSTVKAVTSEYETAKKQLAGLSVGLLHGRMKNEQKEQTLKDMNSHKTDVLVATPVVEVGIDIPDATIIVIEAAERFGLSQLHQLRGRVGRRNKPSYCLLFTEQEDEHTQARLKAMETIHNGPQLADLDLSLRGPGELFGTRQHGVSGLTLASLTDTNLLSRVKRAVASITASDSSLSDFPHLREMVKKSKIESIQS